MALIYRVLQVLVLGVTAAAVDDIPVTWSQGTRSASLQCVVPDWSRLQPRRTLPLDDDRSRPKPYIWMRDGEVINPKRVSQNGTLEVSRKNSGSEGIYQCAVLHHGGRVLGYPTRLKFSFMDKQFTSQPEDVTAWLGQPLSIPCRIGSGPPASISWTRDGVNLPHTNRYHFLESELLIVDARGEDTGLYRCVATNSNLNKSRTSHEGRVVVEDSPLIQAAFLPVQHEQQFSVPGGSRVLLPCPMVGWPRPKVIWKLVPPGGNPRQLRSQEEVLVLDKLQYSQEGVYSCQVDGHNELNKNFTVTLTEPARITLPPQSKEAIGASTVRFNCTAEGRPAPAITWYKDGQRLALAGKINLRLSADRSRIELVISGVSSNDAGNYQCFAQSGGATSSRWARLAVSGAGGAAPGALWCAPAGGTAVALRWSQPAEGVLAYTVDTTAADEHAVAMVGQPTNKTEDIVKVKEPLTPYVFQVRAYVKSTFNKNVATDMSDSVVCQGQGVPITLSKLENDKVLVSWKQFSEQHPGVVQWILQYRHENYTEEEHNITLASHITNYTLAAPASSPLLVRLLGSRTLEWLKQNLTLVPWTSTTSAGEDEDDGAVWSVPRDLEVTEVLERGFTVRWSIDRHEVYSYLVCVRAAYGNDECQESYITSATVEGLRPGTEYEVRVQARVPGRALGGAFSEPYHVNTRPEGPHRFKDLTYEFVNASTLRVSWSGRPAPYTVQHSAQLKLPVEQWEALHTVGNTILINGIDPTEQMFVMVTGYDPLDYSPILNVPAQVKDLEAKDLKYEYTTAGVAVWWGGSGTKTVRFAQNITQPLENWTSINVTTNRVEIPVSDQMLPVFVMVSAGGARRHHVLTIPPSPITYFYYYLGAGAACVLCVCACGVLVCVRREKNARQDRSRRALTTAAGGAEEGSEMRVTRAHNGAAAEPLLNGHLHITENPASKTPNGRLKKGRRVELPAYDAFDLSRHDADTTMETVLDETTYNLLDTSRRPEFDVSRSSRELSANNSFNKLPDDNMNSELTRSTEFQLDNSKIHPTLQPNG